MNDFPEHWANVPRSDDDQSPSSGHRTIDGERHVSDVAGRGSVMSARTGIIACVVVALTLSAAILLHSRQPDLKQEAGPKLPDHALVPFEPAPPPKDMVIALPPPPPALPAPAPSAAARPAPRPAPVPHQHRLLVFENNPGTPASHGTATGAPAAIAVAAEARPALREPGGADAGNGQAKADDLASRLTPTRLTGVSASLLRNQPFLLTMGTLAPCVLQTAMDSTLPGFVTCIIPQDVLGKTGLTLLDRGTRVVGEFRGGVRQGVERLFVVWTRAETPQGVVIQLDSPATDPLGRSGMDGEVDRHFWQRFGGALLLSTVDGVIQAGVAAASKEGTTTINTGQAQSVIAESLRDTITIAPTIRKAQGELVSIVVARDLDFSTVYQIQGAPAPQAITHGENTP